MLQIIYNNFLGFMKEGDYMTKTSLAVDIGASSGRIIEGILKNNKISIREIYRFENSMVKKDNKFCWNIDFIFKNVLDGLKKAISLGDNIDSVGVDTWAVDYVLIDKKNNRIEPVYAYRDHRTDKSMEEVFDKISPKNIYRSTGIQFMQFNTLYQLYEHNKMKNLDNIQTFLMIPDYINYLLTGMKKVEFTNATTTQLFNIHKFNWDENLIKVIGVNRDIFPEIIKAGETLGSLRDEAKQRIGNTDLKVIEPATHDTGSAVAAVPAVDDNFAYISSGTWSLMGIESKKPICSEDALYYNFTNEGGVFDTFRVLKNIMGLWLIQEVKRLYKDKYSFSDLVGLAEKAEPFKCLINPSHTRFLNPDNMIEEIKAYCIETNQEVPQTPGEIARCIFESLAFQYKEVLLQLRKLYKKDINKIYIIGGGCKNKFLNKLCADFTQCQVYAGPVEATAIGNLIVQFIALGEISSLKEGRSIILNSFDIEKYVPSVYEESIKINWNKFESLI